ncbi:protein FAM43A-like [Antedon mediterranea]|uniref:protein FAM43A-like n=1 Tax=Antedon mediterranea TaxID=105859 RepID=UPI003AF52EE1
MAFSRKKSAQFDLTEEPPSFEVCYLGRMITRVKMGRECTKDIVRTLYNKARGRHDLQRVHVTISTKGMRVSESPAIAANRQTFIPIYTVTYGSADKVYQRVFSFITTVQRDNNEESTFVCHAFLCRDTSMAKTMVMHLLSAFKCAFGDWKKYANRQKIKDRLEAGPSISNGVVPDNVNGSSTSTSADLTDNPLEIMLPPKDQSTRVEKVAQWMERWLHLSVPQDSQYVGILFPDDEEEFNREFEEFSRRNGTSSLDRRNSREETLSQSVFPKKEVRRKKSITTS